MGKNELSSQKRKKGKRYKKKQAMTIPPKKVLGVVLYHEGLRVKGRPQKKGGTRETTRISRTGHRKKKA